MNRSIFVLIIFPQSSKTGTLITNLFIYFSILSRWLAPLRSPSIRLSHAPMPARRIVYEYANELKQAALLHTALDYQRCAITHRPAWYISRTPLTACCCNRCGYRSHGDATACRRTYIAHNSLTPDQPKPTGTELRAIRRTEASDWFRRHCKWFSWWTFSKKKKKNMFTMGNICQRNYTI